MWCRSRDLPYPDTAGKETELWHQLAFEFTQIPEMVKYTWWIDGMPRSFFDQMTRYRKTGFFARSQRIRDQRNFWDSGEILTTPEIAESESRSEIWAKVMEMIQWGYRELLDDGCPAEDARGMLPLHLRTGFAWTLTLRDIAEVFRARTCHLLQQSYWSIIIERFRDDLRDVDTRLDILFQPPCKRPEGQCLSRIEANQRITAVTEGRMDLHPCRIYHDEYEPDLVVIAAIEKGLTRWAESSDEAYERIVGEQNANFL